MTANDIVSRPQPNSSDTGFKNSENVAPTSDGMFTIMPTVTAIAIGTSRGLRRAMPLTGSTVLTNSG